MIAKGRLLVVTGAAIILWGISERVFWSLVRPDEQLGGVLLGIVPYWIATYVLLAALHYFRVQRFVEVLFMGALYGWLVEAVYAMTFFGGAGIPLPFSISWTALAWHMLISVGVVWWLHRRAMKQSFGRSLAYSTALGVFWLLWSMSWFFETPPVVNTVGQYALHAFGVTLLMVIGHLLMSQSVTAWVLPRYEVAVVVGVVFLWIGVAVVPAVGGMVAVLPLLALLLWVPATALRTARHGGTAILVLTERVPVRNILTLFIAPLIATVGYSSMLIHPEWIFPFNYVVLFVTTPLGFLVFAYAWWKLFRTRS